MQTREVGKDAKINEDYKNKLELLNNEIGRIHE